MGGNWGVGAFGSEGGGTVTLRGGLTGFFAVCGSGVGSGGGSGGEGGSGGWGAVKGMTAIFTLFLLPGGRPLFFFNSSC